MTDFLAAKQQESNSRLAELQPAVQEYQRLEAAAAALAGLAPPPARAEPRARNAPAAKRPKSARAAEPAGRATKAAARRSRAERRKGSGARSAQALALILAQPGITIPELASAMAIKPNYLYRVLPALRKDQKIAKDGRGWKAT